MAESNILYQHWKKHQKDFIINLRQLKQRLNTESIHEIRVATKKLRAILNLYNSINIETDWNYLFEKTEALFDTLGKYRDIEICSSLINSIEKANNICLNELKTYLSSLQKITRGWANQEIHRYHSNELPRIGLLLKQDNDLNDNENILQQLSLIIQTKLVDIKRIIKSPHKVRKTLKEIYYWILIYPKEQIEDIWHHKELHSILDKYGLWQDYEVLEVRSNHFRKVFLPKAFKEYNLLKEDQIQILETKQLYLNSANRQLKKWIKKVLLVINEQSKV